MMPDTLFKLFNNSSYLFCVISQPEGIITSVNKQLANRLGYFRKELVGVPIQQVCPDFKLNSVKNDISGDKPISIQCNTHTKDRTYLAITWEIHAAENEFILIGKNITELQQTQQSANRHRQQLDIIQQAVEERKASLSSQLNRFLDAGLEYFGLDLGVISHISGETYTIVHIRPEAAFVQQGAKLELPETYCSIMLRKDQPWATNHMLESDFCEHPSYKKYGMESYIGAPVYVENKLYGTLNFTSKESKRPFFTSGDLRFIRLMAAVAGMIIEEFQLKDKRKSSISKLKIARKEAVLANEYKSVFLANMSHELRTPLNAVLGYARLLADEEHLNSEQKKWADIIHSSGNHLLEMINDILSVSKIEAGKLSVEENPFDPQNHFQKIFEMFEHLFRQKEIDFSLEGIARLPHSIITDEAKIRQITINLLSNALKFTSTGKVTLKAEIDDKNNLQMEVSDTGKGIEKESQSKIFDSFVQGNSYTDEGTGLGLTITSRLTKLLHGEINFTSEPGEGSTFFVQIPVKPHEEPETDQPEPQPQTPPFDHQPSALVVDDIMVNRMVLEAILNRMNIQVATAESGEEAVKLAQKNTYDIIFMDIRMPGVDGYEAFSSIREIPDHSQTPIVAVTASGFDDKEQELLSFGFNEFLLKPFTKEELARVLHEFLPES